ELLHEHWMEKRGVTDNMTNNSVDKWYSIARQNGANGGKLIGAGGGGFLMVYCDNGRQRLRSALSGEGLVEFRVRFDFEGSKVMYNV
ncbi:MAG: galactokinase, partial [Thaumarchaeota archaeon]|nr:galactokinase [Nitrososphaerota archaeon]